MLSEDTFCSVIQGGVRRGQGTLAIVKLLNLRSIGRTASIPTWGLASRRFEAAVMAARDDWIYAGLLTESCMGLLFEKRPVDLVDSISEAVIRYGFVDAFGRSERIELEIAVVEVSLAEHASVASAMNAAKEMISGVTPPGYEPERTTPRDWCSLWVAQTEST
jgi:hypothetical protein